MATQIFDRDTILDLVVNFVPLFIILFFVAAFVVVNPFGFDPLASGIQFAILVGSFVLLAILTYVSGVAIAGSEKRETVYPPGQATIEGQKPLHDLEEEEAEQRALMAREREEAAADDEDRDGE